VALAFSDGSKQRIAGLLGKYPTREAAILPVLWVAQEEFGWISNDAIGLVAETLEVTPSQVFSAVTFYTMYHRQPVGRYVVQVCTNVACMLRDAYSVLSRFEEALGVKVGETTPDNQFTLQEVECLAGCGGAPCVAVNDKYYEPVLPEDVYGLIRALRDQALPSSVSGELQVSEAPTVDDAAPSTAPELNDPEQDRDRDD
jgi:NADH-quinone oxidoreductase subunit E